MLERIYLSILGLYAVVFAAVLLTGYMTAGVGGVFCFVIFGLVFMGMIGILPEWSVHNVKAHR